MKPHEFLDSTYKECLLYVNSCIDKETKMLKAQIVLFDSLGEKLISALGSKHPKNKSLVKEFYSDLFEEELNPNKTQSIEEQLRILRGMSKKQ